MFDWEPQVQQEAPPSPAPGVGTTVGADAPAGPTAATTPSAVSVEVGAVASYLSTPIRGATNPFGAGFGGRIGLVLRGAYIGISVVDYLGGKDVDVSYRTLLYGMDLGYDFRFPIVGRTTFTLRPLVGLGGASVYYTDPSLAKVDVVTSASGGSSQSTTSDTITLTGLYLQPALAAQIASASHFFALQGTVLVLPSMAYGGGDALTLVSYGMQAQVGFRF